MRWKRIIPFICALLLLFVSTALASTLTYPKFKAFGTDGLPLIGGHLYTYVTGTTTAKTAYTNQTLTTSATNPIVLDANGEASVYLKGMYRLVLKTADDATTLWTLDRVMGLGSTYFLSITDYGGDLSAAIAAIGSTPSQLLIDQSVTLTANTVIPSTLQLWITDGGKITTTGYTITFGCQPVIGLYQAFLGTGTVLGLKESNPVWFGADGASATTDTAAFQTAMNALNNGGNFIVSPNSVGYKISTAITGLSNVNVIGCGAAGKIANADASAATDISLFTFTGKSNFTVRNLWLTGSAATKNIAVTQASGTGIYLSGCSYFTIEGNRCDYMVFRGIEATDCYYGTIQNNWITNTLNDATNGVYSADLELYATAGQTNSYITVQGNQCLSNTGHGIAVSNVSTGYNKKIEIINNRVYNKIRNGIYFYAGTYGVEDILCEGNYIEKSGWIGIYSPGPNARITIANNHVINSCGGVISGSLPWAGIGVSSGNPSVIFASMIKIEGNTVNGTNGYTGINLVSAHMSDITNNTILGDGVTTAGANIGGIVLRDGNYNRIQGNTVQYSGVEGYGIQMDIATVSTTWTDNKMIGNTIYYPAGFGILTQYQNKSIIADNHVRGDGTNCAKLIYINDLLNATVRDNYLIDGKAGDADMVIVRTASQGMCAIKGNKFFGSKATGYGLVLGANGADNIVEGNDFSGLTALAVATHISDAATRTSRIKNRHGLAVMNGSFTCAASNNTTITNTNVTATSRITITPTNASAATLMSGATALYVSAKNAGVSFVVTTANAAAAAGDEVFDYIIE